MSIETSRHRLPIGADPAPGGGARFRVWAPDRRSVDVVLEDEDGNSIDTVPLGPEADGYFSGFAPHAAAGTLYRYRLDGEPTSYPDPASRFQPLGPHGPSRVVDPSTFLWSDAGWRGITTDDLVVYEMHLGTFTAEGTWAAAERHLPDLADLGVTAIEIMPVADFPGRFGWGYDGVNLFAPSRLYGTPDDARRFVDSAHAHGLGVVLDVVYNHLGPEGNYLAAFARDYFTERYPNEWGEAINFDGPGSAPVREFFLANAAYWIREFHFDGLRLDATQQMFDGSDDHIIAAVVRNARGAAGDRRILVIAENEPQDVRLLLPPSRGGFGVDALWTDDFHHTTRVAVTGKREAYYTGYRGSPQELVSAVKRHFLYQGQHYRWQGQRRGTPTRGLPASAFVTYLENHDQVANSVTGRRLHQLTSPGRYRSITALWLLAPGAPMFFQGQEFASDRPFLYFSDHEPEVARSVREGRARFLAQFPSIADPTVSDRLTDPGDVTTFTRSKLDHAERERHAEAYALHRDLLRLRREDPVISRRGADGLDGAVLSGSALAIRYFSPVSEDRLLVVNLGRALVLEVLPEPLLAPPPGADWRVKWSSEDPRYGGEGIPPLEAAAGWYLAGESALLLVPDAIVTAGPDRPGG